jgi:hypothetical protein
MKIHLEKKKYRSKQSNLSFNLEGYFHDKHKRELKIAKNKNIVNDSVDNQNINFSEHIKELASN